MIKGLVAAFAVSLGLVLGSCSPFAGTVADHWPHFAGGEPDGLPPRPGTPGYAAFIAHGQPSQVPDATPAAVQQTTPVPNAAHVENTAATERTPAPPPPAAPAQEREPDAPDPDAGPDPSALRGGLY